MIEPENIASKIITFNYIDKKLMYKWDTLRFVLREKYIVAEKDITPVQAEKYRGDLYGLFINELYVPKHFTYPMLIVNDYSSFVDYDAKKLKFNLLDFTILTTYYNLFVNDID